MSPGFTPLWPRFGAGTTCWAICVKVSSVTKVCRRSVVSSGYFYIISPPGYNVGCSGVKPKLTDGPVVKIRCLVNYLMGIIRTCYHSQSGPWMVLQRSVHVKGTGDGLEGQLSSFHW